MSKKLLEEQAVRKFMKIAGLQPLTNTFLKETWEEGKKMKEEGLEEAKKEVEEEGLEEVKKVEEEGLEEVKKVEEEGLEEVRELDEGGGQIPFDEASRRMDERAPEDRVNEAKSLSPSKGSKMKGAPASMKMKPASKSTKNGSSGKSLQEEEMPPEGVEDVEMDSSPASGLDVEGLVRELVRVITDKVPGAADVISIEAAEGEEPAEVEMGGEEESGQESGEESMEGGEEELDEVALEQIVAETVKRVKARLNESVQNKSSPKKELAKKVAAKVAERLKKG